MYWRQIAASVAIAILTSAVVGQVQEARLDPSGPLLSSQNFGVSVALEGGFAVVGAPGYPGGGAVYVFYGNGQTWLQVAVLQTSDPSASGFGEVVDISGATILVGARGSNGTYGGEGAAYVFVRSGSFPFYTFTQEAKLTSPQAYTNFEFGSQVSLEGDTAAVSQTGPGTPLGGTGVYIFMRTGSVWSFTTKLVSVNPPPYSPEPWFGYGRSIDLHSDFLAVGAPGWVNDPNNPCGMVDLWRRTGGIWIEEGQIREQNQFSGMSFGLHVAADADRLLVHAYNGPGAGGRVYAFEKSGSTWAETQVLSHGTGSGSEQFGQAIDIDGDFAFIGAPGHDWGNGVQHGAVFVYRWLSGQWQEVAVLGSSESSFGAVGQSVSVSPVAFLVGGGAASHGAVFVFGRSVPFPTAYCTAKVNSSGCMPQIGYAGLPTASGPDDFHITASQVLNNKPGLLIWGRTQAAFPWNGGTLCVQPPITRTAGQVAGGNPPPNDCSGTFDFHFAQAYMTANGIGPGQVVFAQFWSRDQGFAYPTNIGLTDALRFDVGF